jgi:hypothetical protein
MAIFGLKHFNGNAFAPYVDKVPDITRNAFIEAGVLNVRNDLRDRLKDQTGGNYITEQMTGILSGEPDNYDGVTDMTLDELDTFSRGIIVKGTMHGFKEKDFTYDITGGHDFMNDIGVQVAGYKAKVNNRHLKSIAKGIFGVTADNFNTRHTLDITGTSTGMITATTDLDARQKAAGDNADMFTGAIINSVVATNLMKMEVLDFRTNTDALGIQRAIRLANWHGMTALISDDDTVEYPNPTYAKTSDVAVQSGKTYYTRSGSSGNYVYTPVENPTTDDIGSYYEKTGDGDPVYISYLLGEKAFDYCDCGAKVPYETGRDAEKNGGIDKLYMRQRILYAPRGFSFVMPTPAILSPDFEQLATAANWTVATNAAGTEYFNTKAIPFARIISKG